MTNTLFATEMVTCKFEGCTVSVEATAGYCSEHVEAPVQGKVKEAAASAKAKMESILDSVKKRPVFRKVVSKASATASKVKETATSPKVDTIKEKGSSFMGKFVSFTLKAASVVVSITVKAAARVAGFVKKHAVKAGLGLTALAVGGAVTSTMTGALLAGMGIYALAHYGKNYYFNKGTSFSHSDAILTAASQSGWYAGLAAMGLLFGLGFVVAGLGNAFVASYVGYSNLAYLIVA